MATLSPLSVLFLGKKGDTRSEAAAQVLRERFALVDARLGAWGEAFPQELRTWRGDILISFLSRWVVPASAIAGARIAAINFHPAPPEYPGIGCNNFALYDGVREYGVTCHHMAPKVDTGAIIAVRRLPVSPEDNVASLLERAYAVQFELFKEIVSLLSAGGTLPVSQETWTRKPFTRKELDELAILRPEMPVEEIERRIRATSFGAWQPRMVVAGHTFVYQPPVAPTRDGKV